MPYRTTKYANQNYSESTSTCPKEPWSGLWKCGAGSCTHDGSAGSGRAYARDTQPGTQLSLAHSFASVLAKWTGWAPNFSTEVTGTRAFPKPIVSPTDLPLLPCLFDCAKGFREAWTGAHPSVDIQINCTCCCGCFTSLLQATTQHR